MKRLFPFLLLAVTSAQAQQAPDAGRLLQDIGPAPRLPVPRAPAPSVEEPRPGLPADGQRIAVKAFRISGAKAFAQPELLALVNDAVGKELTLAELDALALRITRHYRVAGYLVARAWLPPQEIEDGIVEIAVLEGRIGRVQIDNAAQLAPSALAPLDRIVPGDIVSGPAVESALLSLSDLPGVEVKSTLRPGTAVGTSDFLVDVAPGPALAGSADFDSFGNRYTGTYRLGASLSWNNPARLGDQATLRVQQSDGGMSYGRIGYQLPVGERATRVGASWSQMHYKLGENFASLRADGDAGVGSLYLLHPFLRTREASWYGQLQYDDKRLADRVGATATDTDKKLGNWTYGVNGNLIDGLGGGGSNGLSFAATSGRLSLDAVSAAIDRATARSAGDFTKWSASFQRTQRVEDDMTASVSWSGQWASKNLDSSEKFSLGGAYGVRAYPQGEASGDEGQLLSLELRKRVSAGWELQGFYDAGWVTANRNPWTAAANLRHLAGYGVGTAYAGGGYTLRMFAAWKTGSGQPTSDIDRTPRVWLQAATYF